MNNTAIKYPLIFRNQIIDKHKEKIIEYIDNHKQDFGELNRDDYWGGRTIHIPQIQDDEIKNILIEHKNHMIDRFYELSGNHTKIYVDTLHLVRWPVGYELMPHADAENPDGTQHQFYWRDFGTVTFLNDDFEGGDLYLPNQKIEIKARPGYTGIFPGSLEYLHGVKRITNGTRYTIASFLTYDESKAYKI